MKTEYYTINVCGHDIGKKKYLKQAKELVREEVNTYGYNDPVCYPWGVDVEIKKGHIYYYSHDSGKTYNKIEYRQKELIWQN